jgi:hypothetical protein
MQKFKWSLKKAKKTNRELHAERCDSEFKLLVCSINNFCFVAVKVCPILVPCLLIYMNYFIHSSIQGSNTWTPTFAFLGTSTGGKSKESCAGVVSNKHSDPF